MDIDVNRYLNRTKKGPNSEKAEVIDTATKIVGKPFKQIAGLTRHLDSNRIYLLNKESKGRPELWWWLLQNKFMKEENFKNNQDYILVKEKLEKHPEFRERSMRHTGLIILSLRKCVTKEGSQIVTLQKIYNTRPLTMTEMADCATKYGTYDRWWRKVLEQPENEHLRGSDYYSKAELEERQKSRLGYKQYE